MPLTSLKSVLAAAEARKAACLGLVCLGWEDVTAYAAAAEAARAPLILSAGPGARAHMPVQIWGKMFAEVAAQVAVPVVAHLDHGRTLDEAKAALDAGFTSLMIDGSLLPLEENMALSAAVCDLAPDHVSVEAELGEVGYQDGAASKGTDPREVETFLAAVPCDCLAISIGNSHLQTRGKAVIDWGLAAEITQVADRALVLHGGSGIAQEDRSRLAQDFGVRKFNVGTELRQAFGTGLRATLAQQPDIFDRLTILKSAASHVRSAAEGVLKENWRA